MYKTDRSLLSLKLAEVASSAAVLFQSQLASVNTTSAGNSNILRASKAHSYVGVVLIRDARPFSLDRAVELRTAASTRGARRAHDRRKKWHIFNCGRGARPPQVPEFGTGPFLATKSESPVCIEEYQKPDARETR